MRETFSPPRTGEVFKVMGTTDARACTVQGTWAQQSDSGTGALILGGQQHAMDK
jgi:hypothetical protein